MKRIQGSALTALVITSSMFLASFANAGSGKDCTSAAENSQAKGCSIDAPAPAHSKAKSRKPIYPKLGLKNGDVITGVQSGSSVSTSSDPATVLDAMRAKEKSGKKVKVIRNGESKSIDANEPGEPVQE